jgi:hypothetical protein
MNQTESSVMSRAMLVPPHATMESCTVMADKIPDRTNVIVF